MLYNMVFCAEIAKLCSNRVLGTIDMVYGDQEPALNFFERIECDGYIPQINAEY
jgi:hypothetical protein